MYSITFQLKGLHVQIVNQLSCIVKPHHNITVFYNVTNFDTIENM